MKTVKEEAKEIHQDFQENYIDFFATCDKLLSDEIESLFILSQMDYSKTVKHLDNKNTIIYNFSTSLT